MASLELRVGWLVGLQATVSVTVTSYSYVSMDVLVSTGGAVETVSVWDCFHSRGGVKSQLSDGACNGVGSSRASTYP